MQPHWSPQVISVVSQSPQVPPLFAPPSPLVPSREAGDNFAIIRMAFSPHAPYFILFYFYIRKRSLCPTETTCLWTKTSLNRSISVIATISRLWPRLEFLAMELFSKLNCCLLAACNCLKYGLSFNLESSTIHSQRMGATVASSRGLLAFWLSLT